MKKIKIFFIFLIVILLIYFITVGIKSIIRMNTLNKILDKAISNIDKDNFYLKTTCHNGETKTETIAYYRNGIGRYVAENGIYTWTNGKEAYLIDEENKKAYKLDMENSSEMLIRK